MESHLTERQLDLIRNVQAAMTDVAMWLNDLRVEGIEVKFSVGLGPSGKTELTDFTVMAPVKLPTS